MPILISNNGSILARVIGYCTQTFDVNTDHRFLSILIVSFPSFLLHYYLCCQALNGCYPIV
jgi:hypothetical protein